jgi:hypothetical protein
VENYQHPTSLSVAITQTVLMKREFTSGTAQARKRVVSCSSLLVRGGACDQRHWLPDVRRTRER